ncbi:acetyl-CoA synthetase [Saccharicrinis carchari]|uniref:Acetyl-CoA synthetase n=1 Tax=Saccharicrinis carchari TaxID=1168039 RepID=A0A521CSQ4_SACCC|nr:AMP-binding protein [Saccharicrinis carchari]SMO62507.1 acetyl-CoA synthetase [Saccharicrinis carchari]
MFKKYLRKSEFTSLEDFQKNFEIIVPDRFNFAYDVVDKYASVAPCKRAMCWVNDKGETHEFTFADLKKASDQTASYFQSLGIQRGDKVMLILKRRYEFWFSILALHKIGAVGVPATHLLTHKDIRYRNNAAGIKMIVAVAEPNIVNNINQAMAKSPSVEKLVAVGDATPPGWLSLHKGMEKAVPFVRPEGNEAQENTDISLLYFTSGTTAEPKMVAHNFTYPLSHIVTAKYWQNVQDNGLHLTVSDTGWAKSVWGKLYGQWLAGSAVFVYDFEKFTPADLLEKIDTFKITSLCAPPTIYRFLIREDLTQYNLSALKSASVAGEPLNPIIYDTFYKQTGLKLKEGFGQTETAVQIANFPGMEPKPGSTGVPSPIFDIRLVNNEGMPCIDGEVGEITIHTAEKVPVGLFMGYYRDQEKTASCYYGGNYHTGDLAWRDEDGYYWFVGRLDDVIKSSGYRIGPFEVENALMTHLAVVECAITAVPDEIRGQVVKATIILAPEYRPGDEDLVQQIQDHVKSVTAPYKYPRIIDFVTELPKTISGKIRRVEIREGIV